MCRLQFLIITVRYYYIAIPNTSSNPIFINSKRTANNCRAYHRYFTSSAYVYNGVRGLKQMHRLKIASFKQYRYIAVNIDIFIGKSP